MTEEDLLNMQAAYREGLEFANSLASQCAFLQNPASFENQPPPEIHPNVLEGYQEGISFLQDQLRLFPEPDEEDMTEEEKYELFLQHARGYKVDEEKWEALQKSDFVFNIDTLIRLAEQPGIVQNALNNQKIFIKMRTGLPGHMYMHTPVIKPETNEAELENIGFYPTKHGIGIFVGTEGEARLEENEDKNSEKKLIIQELRITQEQYYQLALNLTKELDDEKKEQEPALKQPRKYHITANFGDNCLTFVDQQLKAVGVVDGLTNKFDCSKYNDSSFAFIKLHADSFFDACNIERTCSQASSSVDDAKSCIDFLEKLSTVRQQQSSKANITSAVKLFVEAHVNKSKTAPGTSKSKYKPG